MADRNSTNYVRIPMSVVPASVVSEGPRADAVAAGAHDAVPRARQEVSYDFPFRRPDALLRSENAFWLRTSNGCK